MPRLFLVVAVAAVLLLAGGLTMYRRAGSRNDRPSAQPVAVRPAPRQTPSATRVDGPEPAPGATSSDRFAARRAVMPKAAAASSSPAPVETTPTTGTLQIVSDVPGAQVFLDRQFIGQTPATVQDVAPGPHQLNVSAPGYDAHVETVDVAAGAREIAIAFREIRLDVAINVVHKHRLGSCRGRLIATAQGLRYDTPDSNDAFGSTLLELDAFQVDYLSKNLRVQPRRGKRYDFTDPDGNADHLFVFHREVDRARERLKKGDTPGGY